MKTAKYPDPCQDLSKSSIDETSQDESRGKDELNDEFLEDVRADTAGESDDSEGCFYRKP
jgi:hypothetical protein